MSSDIPALTETCNKLHDLLRPQLEANNGTDTEQQQQQPAIDESVISDQEDLCFFFPPSDVDKSMAELTEQIRTIIVDLRPKVSDPAYNYLLDMLHDFDFDGTHFTKPLSLNILPSLEHELNAFSMSLRATVAAEKDDLSVVKDFLTAYPSFKDKPLLNGLTLLYVATAKNHEDIVKYLLNDANCSVNAQNLDDAPSAAKSTALHIACADGNSKLVRCLLENGADPYIQNAAQETPTMNINASPALLNIFKEHLVIKNIREGDHILPSRTIEDEIQQAAIGNAGQSRIDTCIWECKSLHEKNWMPFKPEVCKQLSNMLTTTTTSEIKADMTIDLNIDGRMYNISTMKFLKSGNENNTEENQAWIRCLESSFYHFDIVPMWQLMLTQHTAMIDNKHRLAQLNFLEIPDIIDPYQFQYHLNSWYTCDLKMSESIDEAMNKRLRHLTIHTVFLDTIILDLAAFSFSNQTQTIGGYLRWLPRFVTVDPKTKRITYIDNFQAIHLQKTLPVPLTTKLQQESAAATAEQRLRRPSIVDADDTNGMDHQLHEIVNDYIDNVQEKDETSTAAEYPPTILETDISQVQPEIDNDDGESDVDLTVSIANNNRGEEEQAIVTQVSKELDKSSAEIQRLEEDVKEEEVKLAIIQADRSEEEKKGNLLAKLAGDAEHKELIEIRNKYANQEKVLRSLLDQLADLKQHKDDVSRKLEQARDKLAQITRSERLQQKAMTELMDLEYPLPVHECVPLQSSVILNHLKALSYPSKTDHMQNLITIDQKDHSTQENYYMFTLKAYPVHHKEMDAIQARIEYLIRLVNAQQNYHERRSKKMVHHFFDQSIKPVTVRQHLACSRANWKLYCQGLSKLIEEKRREICQTFIEYNRKKCKSLVETTITNKNEWQKQLRASTTEFIQNNSIINSIEVLKRNAFHQFIEQIKAKINTERQPTHKSIAVREAHLAKLEELLESQAIYHGYSAHHFGMLPSLLQRAHIFCQCAQLQLPLFESSLDLLGKIDQHTVIAVSTATGSGKSTLLPALLVADGYDKILVTQPRRLPCNLLSKRVNSSLMSPNVSGWAVSGARSNNVTHAPILYLTDGLLKEYLQYRERDLLRQASKSSRGLVIFVDEVHERSINIDLCLAFLARFLNNHPECHSKIKVIISSATLDPSVARIFRPFNLHEVRITTSTLHQISTHNSDENMINLIHRLSQELELNEQILCFVQSTLEVHQSIKLLALLKNSKSSPLIQSQSATEQQQLIRTQRIFFSTTVAETSLTFPALRYVVDTGLINMPVYDASSDTTSLREMPAAQSTIKQRQGRLGRTRGGEYYALYKHDPTRKEYPTPQICQTELSQIEFSLRRSPLKCGIDHIKQWLPDAPLQTIH